MLLERAGLWGEVSTDRWMSLPKVRVRGKRHGYIMNLDRSDWAQRLTYFLGRYYELAVLGALDALLRPGDRFVDVGANIGMISLHARHLVGDAGRIDSFEPNPDCVDSIHEHLRINDISNVFVHPVALAETRAFMNLNLTSEHSGTATLASAGIDAIRSISVRVCVGDDVLQEPPRLIKIDVEGFERRVLGGFAKTLVAHKPFLILELDDAHLVPAGSSAAAVAGHLFDLGYEAFGLSTARKRLRHRLVLQPVQRHGDFGAFTDVLWSHRDRRAELKATFGARAQVGGP